MSDLRTPEIRLQQAWVCRSRLLMIGIMDMRVRSQGHIQSGRSISVSQGSLRLDETRGAEADSHRYVALVMFWNEKILLQHRDDKPGLRDRGLWVVPGGRVELGETLVEAVEREFQEETGISIANPVFSCMFVDRRSNTPSASPHTIWFFAAYYDGFSPYTCLEGQALAFHATDALARLPHPAYLSAVIRLAHHSLTDS